MVGVNGLWILQISLLCFSATAALGGVNILGYGGQSGIGDGSEGPRVRSELEMRWLHDEWLVRVDKSYKDISEKERRFEIFKDNLRFIDEHNRPGNNYTYRLGLTEFADITDEEFREQFLMRPMSNLTDERSVDDGAVALLRNEEEEEERGQLPQEVDWRKAGAVSPVVNQGICACCWAWAAAGAIEGLHQIKTGNMIPLSAQQFVDCVPKPNNCRGGWPEDAMRVAERMGGVDSLENYPYKMKEGVCNVNADKVASIVSHNTVPAKDEIALQGAVVRQPITAVLEVLTTQFRLYSEGIYNGPCSAIVDHAMLAIGYGTAKGQDYWLLKNTFGIFWGENGFARMQRNVADPSGICHITHRRSYYPVK